MERLVGKITTCLLTFAIAAVVGSQAAIADGTPPTPSTPAPPLSPDLAQRVLEVTDAVLEHHIDPPARQQMILSGIKALHRAAGVPIPPGLSRRISELATPEQVATFLASVWPSSTVKPRTTMDLQEALLNGLLHSVPGGARLVSAKDRKVEEQFEGNRYVGIHIALGMDEKEKRPVISQVFEGGPADRAGVKEGDMLETVDGFDTKGMRLRDVVDHTRGDEGTDVVITVRQPKESKSRTLKITRGVRPHPTIEGLRKVESGDWVVRFTGPGPIGYLKITEIGASTPHELRKLAQQLEREGIRALVVDLRRVLRATSAHSAVLLADCLLDHGTIGRVRSSHGEQTYQAEPDALFRGWPIAVLVDGRTEGTAEWLAAALQDNHRASIVGTPTAGAHRTRELDASSGVRSMVSVGDGSWSIELTTGLLERGDGRLMSDPMAATIGDPESFPILPRSSRKIEIGVKPDVIAGKNTSKPDGLLGAGSRGQEQEHATKSDPLEEAVELLRKALKEI